jgi:casein kinase II subunit beta
MGLSDVPNLKPAKLYCARCEDTYNPKSSRHASIDGAYFGTSFHNILFQVYPTLIPAKSAERYVPRVYGFKVHAAAALVRWQNGVRGDMRRRLRKMEVESGFKDGEDELEEDEDDEEEEDAEGGQAQQPQQQAIEYRASVPAITAGPSSSFAGEAQMGSVA